MSKFQHVYDRLLSIMGRGMLHMWWSNPRSRRQRTWWAEMAVTDGHGKIRNQPCPCRSGLKFKYCHGATQQQKDHWKRQQEEHRDSIRIRNATDERTGLRA